ncbi:MAG: hypothetical protein ACI8S7_000211, partial [Candidatus Krumholzibacteriia bacterium]
TEIGARFGDVSGGDVSLPKTRTPQKESFLA